MLPTDCEELWIAYLRAEKDRVRGEFLPALDRFIDALLRHNKSIWHGWAVGLASDIADHGRDVPVRFALFQRVLLPALTTSVLARRPGCARWLAHFGTLLAKRSNSGLPDSLNSSLALLKEATRVDPSDRQAREQVVKRTASDFDYALHELPAGVLYGHDGANISECDGLIESLEEFRNHVAILGEEARFGDLIADCAHHFRCYREYVSLNRPGGSYERYLTQRNCEGLP